MSIWLAMKTADGGERLFPVRNGTVIGRESRCHVRIALPAVSDRHCELRIADGRVHLTDLQSDSGTFHNGAKVATATLTHSDTLTIGPVTFELRVHDGVAGRTIPVDGVGQHDDVVEATETPEIKIVPKRSKQPDGTAAPPRSE